MAAAVHVLPAFGLPYATAEFDELGYHLVCSVCGAKCRAAGRARSEDAVTKGALAAYQDHFTRRARVDALLTVERG